MEGRAGYRADLPCALGLSGALNNVTDNDRARDEAGWDGVDTAREAARPLQIVHLHSRTWDWAARLAADRLNNALGPPRSSLVSGAERTTRGWPTAHDAQCSALLIIQYWQGLVQELR